MAGFAVAVLIACAVVLFQQRQVQEKLRADAELLRQQVAQLKADNENLSNLADQAKSSQSLPDEQFTELLKLRGEVGLLRRQTNELGKLREENRQLQSHVSTAPNQTGQISSEDLFELHQIHVVNAMKQLGLAMRIYAGDNNGQYATNFDQIKNELGGVTNFNGVGLDAIEFVNPGLVNGSMPDKIIFLEKTPRQNPGEDLWSRVYGLADGSAQTIYSGNDGKGFDAYEQQHMVSPSPNQ
ncbi:MAG TPA: hypothetical protein VIK35_09425 [Verrucomicrobiae bacterium]